MQPMQPPNGNNLPPSLADVHTCCTEELARYRRRQSSADSVCCREIVRRAIAAPADNELFTTLLAITRPTIERHCPADLRPHLDDFMQEVHTRLWKRLNGSNQTLAFATFAQYAAYVQVTCHSVATEFYKRNPPHASLDQLYAAQGFEPPADNAIKRVEQRMLLERQVELLPDALMQAAFRRRFIQGETSAEVAAALGIPVQDVYRLIERAIRHLSQHPEVHDMLET